MSIQLVTYANQTVTPTNDAIIYERAIDQNGIFYGCNVTVSSNNVNITGGYGIICGREFVIQSESIAVTLAPSGTLEGRLYVRLDLADADAPIQLLTATGNTLPPLEQDADVNYTNGAYEMELATFTVGVSALSDVVETFETIVGSQEKIDSVLPLFDAPVGGAETVTFPFTATKSGIFIAVVTPPNNTTSYVYITENDSVHARGYSTGVNYTIVFPVVKGKTYKIASSANYNFSNGARVYPIMGGGN